MSSPTESEIQDQIGKACKMFDELRLFAHGNSPNLRDMEGQFIEALEGDYAAQAAAGLAQWRGSIASAVRQAQGVLTPLLLQYAKFLDVPETNPISVLERIWDYFVANNKSVKTRAFTFGTPSAGGSNVGSGTINRLTTDENGDDIENQHADAKTAQCIADEHSGTSEHEEVFQFRGGVALKDDLERIGSGLSGNNTALSAKMSRSFLRNPSFDTLDGTVSALNSIPGWTVGSSLTNFNLSTTDYRDAPGVTTPYSLKFLTNDYVQQNFNNLQIRLNPKRPMYLQVAYNASADSCDGVLTLTMGDVTAQVADLSLAAAGWNILRIGLSEDNWFKNFNKEDPLVKIALSGRTTGTLLVDDVIFAPFTQFDGAWYAVVGGATPFLRDDIFTWTDIEVGAIIQRWLWRVYKRYLPHHSSPTWADPTTINPTPTPTPSPSPTPTPTPRTPTPTPRTPTPTPTPSPTPTPTV